MWLWGSFMNKWILSAVLVLSACGYSPVYEKTAKTFTQVSVGSVQVAQDQKLPGERRVAQLVERRLTQIFTASEASAYTLNVFLDEDRRTLAVLRDATEDRFEVTLRARIHLQNNAGEKVFVKDIVSSAPYNVESSPYGTEAGKDRARQSAAESISAEVIKNVNFYLHSQE